MNQILHPRLSRRVTSIFAAGLWWCASLFTAAAQADPPAPAASRTIMTWVPPYSIDKCRARLKTDIDGFGPKDALTHLALQFWIPTREGGVEKTSQYGAISDATIVEFRDWARRHGIRTLLCVYNHVGAWDWTIAQAGFEAHPEKFVDALVAEMKRLDLDGIDIDLEGNGKFEASKEPYIAFIRSLGRRLHEEHKQLTVDSFPDKWNAPNQSWWADLFPHVDGLNTMGYKYIGVNASEWRSYSAQKAAAGSHASRLLLGVPGADSEWQGNAVGEHMNWIFHDPDVGVGIWDATFSAPYWSTPEPWKGLAKMRGGPPPPGANSR
jgi:hypothetical protein